MESQFLLHQNHGASLSCVLCQRNYLHVVILYILASGVPLSLAPTYAYTFTYTHTLMIVHANTHTHTSNNT